MIFVTAFPTSWRLQELKKAVSVTLKGGYNTLNLGSLSKQRYIVGVVKECTIG